MTDQLPYTGERMVPEAADPTTFLEHIYRYRWARKWTPGKDVLDIACGEGYGAAALLAAGARSVVGVDISDEAVAHARSRYRIDARVGDACAIPVEDASIDVVVSFETIEHVAAAENFVDEAWRVCRDGGLFLVSTPNPPVFDRRGPNEFHVREMMPKDFVQLLSRRFRVQRRYVQCLYAVRWWSPRFVSAEHSPWAEVPGAGRALNRLRRALCDRTSGAYTEFARQNAIAAINEPESWLSEYFNPFAVRMDRFAAGCVSRPLFDTP